MKNTFWGKGLIGVVFVSALASAWGFRDWLPSPDSETAEEEEHIVASQELTVLELSPQARKNLSLVSKAARTAEYWRRIAIPGIVEDRPGVSDRGVVAPAIGMVTEIHAFPGDTVSPADPVCTLRLFSEYLQNSQSELFKAQQEVQIIQERLDRIARVARIGGVTESELVALRADMSRQKTLIRAARQELLMRGLLPKQIDQVQEKGEFVAAIQIGAPPARLPSEQQVSFEVQDLLVEVGQQVQAGELLARLANHQQLYVVGNAFRREADFLESAANERRELRIEFADDSIDLWEPLEQALHIRNLSNVIDIDSRTFDFFVPLENQSRTYSKDSKEFLVWRFRPGQRARIHVPVEKYENVFVLPSGAVARDGPEAYVYRQNGDLFKQIPVNILHEDRLEVVIANDGSITPGTFIAQNAGASLRRVLKSQSASGAQPGFHVHADGTVHAAH